MFYLYVREVNKNVGLDFKVQTYVFVYEVTTKVSRFHYKTVLFSLQKCALLSPNLLIFFLLVFR